MEIDRNSTQESGFVFPLNGRVVIIDDNKDEAIPLMNVLSRHCIPFTYFDGNKDNLPEKPVDNVRIIFLDIQLEGMEGVQNDKTKLSALENVIKKVIGDKPDLYIIIAWTKHDELINDIKSSLSPKPFIILNLEKATCKNKNGEYNLSKINDNLIDAINKFGAFRFFIEWENIVHISSGKTVNEISSIIALDDKWNQNINEILRILAEAYAGKQADNNFELNAMLAINNLLLDIIENRIQNSKNNTSSIINNQNVNLTDINRIKGELNRRLLIANEQNKSVIPGNVYDECPNIIKIYDLCDEDSLYEPFAESKGLKREDVIDKNKKIKKELKKEFHDFFEKLRDDIKRQTKNVFLEVSPYCDYAQKKWKCNRILPGVIWSEQYGNILKKADYIYRTPLFLINDQLCFFVFDLRYLTSVSPNSLSNKTSLYRFRKELVVDIQSKIAGHINRPGITHAG
ncbi:MAG: hypothetical protein IMW88_01830 [Thermoflavifilum sp.]|uniref:hypothetical protein n=1 Tax=Thermoflavifilum sp. TaxID=1968839 RepID=UPI0018A440AA|nr:hypothetical protein [Thermoflavifilum sp.]QOR76330.1 MAG: hypothetical protein IMW88_01830 [Thermoflavifilum sp.]